MSIPTTSKTVRPKVSIACTTFNHASYIRQAIEGFLCQTTNFDYEIVVHDDASTDNTVAILKEYAVAHPGKVRLIIQEANQYSKGITSAITTFLACKGDYVAFCEGDDYWTNPGKLQKQVDFLDANPSHSMVFHNAILDFEGRDQTASPTLACTLDKHQFTLDDVIARDWFIPSHSMMFRAGLLELSAPWLHKVFGLDFAMHLLLAEAGPIGYLDEVMGAYRINGGSISANRPAGFFQLKLLQTLQLFNQHTMFRYDKAIWARSQREADLLYLSKLSARPRYIRLLSADYYAFKMRNIVRRLRRRAARQ